MTNRIANTFSLSDVINVNKLSRTRNSVTLTPLANFITVNKLYRTVNVSTLPTLFDVINVNNLLRTRSPINSLNLIELIDDTERNINLIKSSQPTEGGFNQTEFPTVYGYIQ